MTKNVTKFPAPTLEMASVLEGCTATLAAAMDVVEAQQGPNPTLRKQLADTRARVAEYRERATRVAEG